MATRKWYPWPLGEAQPRAIALRKAATGLPTHSSDLSEDPGLTTYFFPGRDGVGGWG